MSGAVAPSNAPDSLYSLLPAVFRMRDAERGYPLRSLLRAIQAQAEEFAHDIGQLYANWFIETCEDELVPYFAGQVGLALGPSLTSDRSVDPVWRRRQVADAIRDRRRKGSFSVLEHLAADATGWPVRAVEPGALAMGMQSVRLADVGLRQLTDLRDSDALDQLGGPLSTAAPLCDVRRLSSHRTPGSGAPGSVAVWLWRLAAERVSRAPAASAGDDGRYTFDQLARDTSLTVMPSSRTGGTAAAGDLDVPGAITRQALAHRLEDYYGLGRSICVYRGGDPIPRSQVLVADLADWRARTPPGCVSIDPELGRIAFPARHPPEEGVSVTYARCGMGAIGGGDYRRAITPVPSGATVYRVGTSGGGLHHTVGAALDAWRAAQRDGTAGRAAVVEIVDDGVYEERYRIELAAGERLHIHATQGRRPVLIPVGARSNRPDQFRLSGPVAPEAEHSERRYEELGPPVVVLDGIWIAGHPVELTGSFGAVNVCHCTLVPSSGLSQIEGERDRGAPALIVRAMPCPISIASSVVGRVRIESPETGFDPIPLIVTDSVIDASSWAGKAVLGADDGRAWARLSLHRATVLGSIEIEAVELVEDSIVTAPLRCERQQTGAVRFSYVALRSRTPRRTSCQPDDVLADVEAAVARGEIAANERIRVQSVEAARVAPRFDSVHFGEGAYARLATDAARELTRGAHDEGELGAYHDLWHSQRMADLHARLQEFAPAGIDIDIRVAT